MAKVRYFLQLSYNGTNYHGWQIQDDVSSIQLELEDKLSTILQTETSVTGCGRTDTGVHAKVYFAHFDVEQLPVDTKTLQHKLNSMLSKDIAIQRVFPVVEDAHARFSATKRSYQYRIIQTKDPFEQKTAYRYSPKLNVEAMNKASKLLLGEKDFGCFCKAKANNYTDICTVYNAEWTSKNHLLLFDITANRFLRNMVRAIVGTMLEVGLGRKNQDEFLAVLNSNDRTAAGRSVPSHGLYLTAVEYPSTIFLKNQ